MWSVCNIIIPTSWIDVVKVALELTSQLQWTTWFIGEAENIERRAKLRDVDIFQDQLLAEGDNATLERQCNVYMMITSWLYVMQQL